MRFLLVALLALAGCSADAERRPLHGDVTFSVEERAAIERGNAWVAERVGAEPYAIVWDLPHTSDPASAGDFVIVRGVSRPTFSGWGLPNGHVEVAPDVLEQAGGDLAVIAAHEFGHTYGLRHLPPGVAGLMNPSSEEALVWTGADEAGCVAERVCVR